jgi:hypothetical protein
MPTNVVTATTASKLLPGIGFTGPTAQPATVGLPTQTGYTTEAIARWDVVPFQTFTGSFDAGVVAFDISGIDHVAFSANGGAWFNVSQMTLNPQTGVMEYWATLQASDFADGAVELRAIVYPKVGQPRVLAGSTVSSSGNESIIEYADGHGTLSQQTLWVSTTGNDTTGDGSFQNPFGTILKAAQTASSGATIYLEAGTYQFTSPNSGSNDNDRWITITAAPGLTKSDVTIQPLQNGIRIDHLAISNVTIDCTKGYDLTVGYTYWSDPELWVDNCDITSSLGKSYTPEISASIDVSWSNAYLTNSTIHDYPGRAIAFVTIVRNVQINNIGDDAIDGPNLVVNTTINNVIANDPLDHIDAIQWMVNHNDANSIVFNVKATNVDGQLLFGANLTQAEGGVANGVFNNVAVVNYLGVTLRGPIASPGASAIGGAGPSNNLLFYNVTLPDQSFLFLDDRADSPYTNTVVEGCVFWRFAIHTTGEITVQALHIIQYDSNPYMPAAYVGDYTTGNPGFVSPPNPDGTYSSTDNFHLLPTSVLLDRISVSLVPIDLDGLVRPTTLDSIGAFGD